MRTTAPPRARHQLPRAAAAPAVFTACKAATHQVCSETSWSVIPITFSLMVSATITSASPEGRNSTAFCEAWAPERTVTVRRAIAWSEGGLVCAGVSAGHPAPRRQFAARTLTWFHVRLLRNSMTPRPQRRATERRSRNLRPQSGWRMATAITHSRLNENGDDMLYTSTKRVYTTTVEKVKRFLSLLKRGPEELSCGRSGH